MGDSDELSDSFEAVVEEFDMSVRRPTAVPEESFLGPDNLEICRVDSPLPCPSTQTSTQARGESLSEREILRLVRSTPQIAMQSWCDHGFDAPSFNIKSPRSFHRNVRHMIVCFNKHVPNKTILSTSPLVSYTPILVYQNSLYMVFLQVGPMFKSKKKTYCISNQKYIGP